MKYFPAITSISFSLLVLFGLVFLVPKPAYALLVGGGGAPSSTTSPNCQPTTFFGLVPWYQYLKVNPQYINVNPQNLKVNPQPSGKQQGTLICQVCFNVLGTQTLNANCSQSQTSDISLVLLAVVDDLLRLAGIIAIAMVLYASVTFIISQGEPEAVARARSSIINALIGAAIAMVAVVLVSYIGSQLGG